MSAFIAILIIILLLYICYQFASWVQAGGWILLLVLTVLAIVVGLLYIANKKFEERRLEQERLESERRKKLEFLNAPEPVPKLIPYRRPGNMPKKRKNG